MLRSPIVQGSSATEELILCPLEQERDDLVMTMGAVEKERDFYFDKLREIELLLQVTHTPRSLSPGSLVLLGTYFLWGWIITIPGVRCWQESDGLHSHD